MKLYYSKASCSLAVRILIHELKLHAEFEAVNLKTKITEKNVNYYDINPKGAVPALVIENGELLTENAVIHQYLADKEEATHLLPPVNHLKRYRVLEWLNFVSNDLHKAFGPIFNEKIPANIKEEIYKPFIKSKFAIVEGALSEHPFLCGEEFTLPDGYLFTVSRWLPIAHIAYEEFPHVKRFYEMMHERPSCHQALKEEGLLKNNL